MLVLKITLLNACEIKKFWPLCLQPAELYYILLVFSCWMENLLNKSDTKKCLSTLRMKRVFINVWMNKMVLLLKVSWSGYKVGMNWKTVNPFRTFRIEFREWLCPFLPQGHWLIAIWTWLAGTRVSWWCPIFHEIACIKKKLFQKDNYFSCEFWNSPICYWQSQPVGKFSSLCPASGVWTGILLIWNVTS